MSSWRNAFSITKGMQSLRGIALAFVGAALLTCPALAHVYQYDNATSGTIPDPGSDDAGDCSVTTFDRTFVVPATDSFTVAHISVGLNVTHSDRGQLRVEILRPGSATPFAALTGATSGGDDDNNYDILLSSNSDAGEDGTAPVDDNDEDPVAAPFFNRLVTVSGIDFFTGNSVGTWTLRICDVDSAGGTSTFNRARLILESSTAAGSVCTSRMTYDWQTNGNNAVFSSTTVGDVTLSQTTTTNFSGGLNNVGSGWYNFRTDSDNLGGHDGYYSLYMDAQNTTGTQDSEVLGQLVTFSFSSAAQDLEFSTLDSDQADDDFEDIIRVEGAAVGGGLARYGRTSPDATPNFQIAGDGIEGDSACDNGANCATETYKFDRALTAVTVHYDAADDVPSEPGDQLVGISDFSFCAFDYGDAPNTYGDQLSSGPKHVLGNRLLYLGTNAPDGESDGQPGANANTDDNTAISGADDEDGVSTFGSCPGNGTYSVTVNATNGSGATGYLVGYVDWNRDGDFADSGERSTTHTVPTGTTNSNRTVSWSSVPSVCGGNTATYARFRFTTTQARAESPTDAAGTQAPDGEVEDYLIAAGTLPVTIAYVDSERRAGGLRVRWTTATETSNAGFRLWGLDAHGGRTLLDTVRSRRPDSFAPQSYEVDVAAGPEVVAVQLEDLSLFGLTRRHGPFPVGTAAGQEPTRAAIDWAAVRAETGVGAAIANGAPGTSGLLLVREKGIHRVTYEQLVAAGIDLAGADPDRIALLDDGKAMPRFVASSDKTFGPGDFIEFVARPRLTLASPVDAIELHGDASNQAVVGRLTARGGTLGVVSALDVHEADSNYSFSSPNGDPWYEQGLLAWGGPASLTRTFDLPQLVNGQVILDLQAWGYGDFPGVDPDHHVVVRVNGQEIVNARFDGLTPWQRKLDVTDLVTASGNQLEVLVPGDTGFEFDYVAFDGFAVSYRRQTLARNDRFEGTLTTTGTRIAGFVPGSEVAIWKLADNGGADRGVQVAAADGSVSVAPTGEVYAAAAPRLLTPAAVPGIPVPQRKSGAQYLIVAHPSLVPSLEPLVGLEQGRGFTTEVVTTDSIFAAYSDHASSPAALRSFLLASRAEGNLRYVLLVGADTTDPWDHLGRGSISFVPTEYLPYAQYVTFSPTDEHLVDGDRDGLADVPIGRLPVRTPSEASAVIAKLLRWEQMLPSTHKQAMLVSGASDSGQELAEVDDRFRNALGSWQADLVQVDHQGSAPARQMVLAGFHAGTPLMSFVGHSAPGQWDFTPLLTWQDAADLTNAAHPNLVAQWGCWNSYYVDPAYESLSAHLLRASGGAAAAIGASTLLPQAVQQQLGVLFLAQVDRGGQTLGEALNAAKRELVAGGGGHDVALGTILLGDPATSLPLDHPQP
jgi:subtilisin-like proprotein convertase family protein